MLTDNATMEFDGVGPLACLHTDGLRTLLRTMEIPDMWEETLRYPGHADQMRVLRDAGFLGTDPVDVNDVEIRPIDLVATLIAPHWVFQPGEPDLTIMRLIIAGEEDGKPVTYTYDLHDEYDPETGTLSMARTTGYTCTAVARLVLEGGFKQKGICPPEFVGMTDGCREQVEKYLADRGVVYRMSRS
jgi:saccharopine dehydrogenase-like NADP-dependent oxidoreductase